MRKGRSIGIRALIPVSATAAWRAFSPAGSLRLIIRVSTPRLEPPLSASGSGNSNYAPGPRPILDLPGIFQFTRLENMIFSTRHQQL